MSHQARQCVDCHIVIAPGEPARGSAEEPLCRLCAEVRELAWVTLKARQEATPVRRGPRHLVPRDLAAQVFLHGGDGTTAGPVEPILEISPRGFRVGSWRRHEVGQRLQCRARLPGQPAAPIEFDVEVRWCRPGRADRFEIGVEAAEPEEGFGEVYRALLAAMERRA
jgi:hypothetical protein